MNIAWVVLITVPALALAYRFYGRAVARWLGEDRSCPTPAVLSKDDKDFVPTRLGGGRQTLARAPGRAG